MLADLHSQRGFAPADDSAGLASRTGLVSRPLVQGYLEAIQGVKWVEEESALALESALGCSENANTLFRVPAFSSKEKLPMRPVLQQSVRAAGETVDSGRFLCSATAVRGRGDGGLPAGRARVWCAQSERSHQHARIWRA